MLALGARYSPLRGSDNLADVLSDMVSKSLGNCITSDHVLARDIQLQRAAILWSLQRSTGSRRLMEITEVLRGTHCVALRQLHCFDDSIPMPRLVLDLSASLDKRWRTWVAWEGRRRSGFAAFLADADFTIFLGRPAIVLPWVQQSSSKGMSS